MLPDRLRYFPWPVAFQAGAIVLAGCAVVGVGLGAVHVLNDRADGAIHHGEAALYATRISLSATTSEHIAMDWDQGDSSVTPRSVVEVHGYVEQALSDARSLELIKGSSSVGYISADLEAADKALLTFAGSRSQSDLQAFQSAIGVVRQKSDHVAPILDAESHREHARQNRVASLAPLIMALAIATGGLVVGVASLIVSRRFTRALRRSRSENAALSASKLTVERRNGQFQALYQVMSEVSETLSMKYVVQTTVRESRRLVDADAVVLRLIRGNRLEVVGTDHRDGIAIGTLEPIELGEGLIGRVARRGRPMRVDVRNADTSDLSVDMPGVQSGLVVPLIVGARIVGTLACWATTPGLLTEDDEQALSMMAAQVATAVAAADTHAATEHEAHHDPLTGLPNRRQLDGDIQEEFDPGLKSGTNLAVAMLDIDHFKRLNDEFGHRIGDITLQRIAEVIRTALREGDHVYRYGGEEFAVVLPGVSPDAARHLLDRLRKAVEGTPLVGENLQPIGRVTISGGLAFGGAQADSMSALLKLADLALYEAKSAGRNRVRVYSPPLNEGTGEPPAQAA